MSPNCNGKGSFSRCRKPRRYAGEEHRHAVAITTPQDLCPQRCQDRRRTVLHDFQKTGDLIAVDFEFDAVRAVRAALLHPEFCEQGLDPGLQRFTGARDEIQNPREVAGGAFGLDRLFRTGQRSLGKSLPIIRRLPPRGSDDGGIAVSTPFPHSGFDLVSLG